MYHGYLGHVFIDVPITRLPYNTYKAYLHVMHLGHVNIHNYLLHSGCNFWKHFKNLYLYLQGNISNVPQMKSLLWRRMEHLCVPAGHIPAEQQYFHKTHLDLKKHTPFITAGMSFHLRIEISKGLLGIKHGFITSNAIMVTQRINFGIVKILFCKTSAAYTVPNWCPKNLFSYKSSPHPLAYQRYINLSSDEKKGL